MIKVGFLIVLLMPRLFFKCKKEQLGNPFLIRINVTANPLPMLHEFYKNAIPAKNTLGQMHTKSGLNYTVDKLVTKHSYCFVSCILNPLDIQTREEHFQFYVADNFVQHADRKTLHT